MVLKEFRKIINMYNYKKYIGEEIVLPVSSCSDVDDYEDEGSHIYTVMAVLLI